MKLKYKLFVLLIVLLIVPRKSALSAEVISAGELIKGSLPAVYYISNSSTRFAFPNEVTYFSWYSDFSKVKIVTDAELASFTLGGLVTIRPGIAPVKIASEDKIYGIAHGGVLRELRTTAIAEMIYGSAWKSKLIPIPDAFLSSYKIGDPVTASGQYWWKQEFDKSPTIKDDLTPLVSVTLNAVTTIPKTTTTKKYNLAVGLWYPHDPAVPTISSKAEIGNMLFGENNTNKSVAEYFSKMSGGAVELANAGVYGWYDADKPYEHYWAASDSADADQDGYINGHNEKWAETILKMDKEMDFSKYDTNKDGTLSTDELGILIVIPATGTFGTNRVVVAQEFPTVKPMVVDGVKIGLIAEWYTGIPANLPAVTHELTHLFLNTTDMYFTSKFRAGNFSLMDGSYCNCFLDPWQRIAQGKNWLNILQPTGSGYYQIPSVNTSNSVMKIARPGTDEFFLIEYRNHDEYNSVGVPGILIWNILDSTTNGDWGRNNIHLLRANGGEPVDDFKASYYGIAGQSIGTGELKWFDGTASGISLSEIGLAGSTIQFKLNLNQ